MFSLMDFAYFIEGETLHNVTIHYKLWLFLSHLIAHKLSRLNIVHSYKYEIIFSKLVI